jgi:hypothetical protein
VTFSCKLIPSAAFHAFQRFSKRYVIVSTCIARAGDQATHMMRAALSRTFSVSHHDAVIVCCTTMYMYHRLDRKKYITAGVGVYTSTYTSGSAILQ